jgi:hypothetical protein
LAALAIELGVIHSMTILLWTTVVFLTLDAGLIAYLLLCQIRVPLTSTSIPEIAPLIVLAGVLTAVVAFLFNLRRGRSEDILEAAADLLEKAFDALEPKEGVPINRRHAWLSAARLIATSEKLSKHIVEPSHRSIYNQKKEYWRGRLYDLLFPSPPEGLPSAFYADKPEHMISWSGNARDPLSEKSLAFMYRFIRWPEGAIDPIGEVPVFTDEEIARMESFGPRGLGTLLAEARALAKKSPVPK